MEKEYQREYQIYVIYEDDLSVGAWVTVSKEKYRSEFLPKRIITRINDINLIIIA